MMSEFSFCTIAAFVITYLLISTKTQLALISSAFFNKRQKLLNSILIWCIPFLWAMVIKGFLKKDDSGVMTKDKRGKDNGNFYESGIGVDG